MAPQREIDEETAAGVLAQFLVDLTRNTPVRDLATKFGKSSSSWGNYLKGSHLIPKPLLGRLVEAFTRPGQARNDTAVRAAALWNAADAERRAGRTSDTGGHLVRQHQKLDDALQQLVKYRALALKTDRQLDELRSLLVYSKGRLENAQLQIQLSGERERGRVERRLSEAKEHLGRVRVQQERARTRRMTVEEQQEFWMAEVLAAQQEISRLERESQDLVVLPPGTLEETRPDLTEAMDEADFEARLEHLTAEGLQDEALIEEDRRLTWDAADDDVLQVPHVIQGAVQPVSNTGLDKPPNSENTQNDRASVAIVVHASDATPAVPAPRSAAQPDPEAPPPALGSGSCTGSAFSWKTCPTNQTHLPTPRTAPPSHTRKRSDPTLCTGRSPGTSATKATSSPFAGMRFPSPWQLSTASSTGPFKALQRGQAKGQSSCPWWCVCRCCTGACEPHRCRSGRPVSLPSCSR
ncbi:hypothetical protein OG365_39720 (plasmid) [Streptomyces sp. NBC_00853]|uniref:hypothetical protein n=1 Tax=Streptomyces sp. NBC_00853 TaxID=2903681 RepID=UPI002F91AA37|nr:hypothetical protein OG365_39720 [Streptomyces sp. NBC_00853]